MGPYDALLLTGIKSVGPVNYLYILDVFNRADGQLHLAVAAEKNKASQALGGGPPFLGVFPGNSHYNLGPSDDWADSDKFTMKALSIAKEHFGIIEDPIEFEPKKPWWKLW